MARFESKIVGIDLGTTNTLISYYDEIAGRGECCVDAEGTNFLPSAVYFESPNKTIVGKTAKEEAVLYPEKTIMRFKRLMGQTKEAIVVDGESISPQELSAIILRRVVENAKDTLEEEIKKAVITVPAYFSSDARRSTREAGEIAGLEVVDIIDEPIAALYHCDNISNLIGKTVLIFDLGGGTLDIVVAKVSADEIEEVVINGSAKLGGADWDDMFVDYIKNKCLNGKHQDVEEKQALLLDVERVKKTLSSKDQARLAISSLEGRESVIITRKEFEDVTKQLLVKIENILNDTIREMSEVGIGDIDKVILVGGATRMCQIRELLGRMFPNIEIVSKDVDEAVAKGAGIYSKLYSSDFNMLTVKRLTKISSRSYGTNVRVRATGKFQISTMIPKGTKLPVEVQENFFIAHENQKRVSFDVYEYFSTEKYIDFDGTYLVAKSSLEIKEPLPENSIVSGKMCIDIDGTLHMQGYEPKGNTFVEISVESKTSLSESEKTKNRRYIDNMEIID